MALRFAAVEMSLLLLLVFWNGSKLTGMERDQKPSNDEIIWKRWTENPWNFTNCLVGCRWIFFFFVWRVCTNLLGQETTTVVAIVLVLAFVYVRLTTNENEVDNGDHKDFGVLCVFCVKKCF